MKTKNIPVILMLVAGAAVSIVTYVTNYELKSMLAILLAVLILFYIAGLIIRKVFDSFQIEKKEDENAIEAMEDIEAEGEVIKKEGDDGMEGR